MESEKFRKSIYKRPELRGRKELVASNEWLEYSKEVAQGKLTKILNPDFTEFSIRYANIEEYRDLLENERFGGQLWRQVVLYGKKVSNLRDRTIPFSVFLEDAKNRVGDTDWYQSAQRLKTAEDLISEMREAAHSRKEGTDRNSRLEQVRQRIIGFIEHISADREISPFTGLGRGGFHNRKYSSKIREKVGFLSEAQFLELQKDIQDRFNKKNSISPLILQHEMEEKFGLSPEQSFDLLFFIERYVEELGLGEQNIEILEKLRDDPSYIQQKGALREILTACTHLMDDARRKDDRQYQIALVFDNEVFGFAKESGEGWSSFPGKRKDVLNDELRKGLLAAISIMPLKNLYGEMIEVEKGSGNFAHPIFDSQGLLRWPK